MQSKDYVPSSRERLEVVIGHNLFKSVTRWTRIHAAFLQLWFGLHIFRVVMAIVVRHYPFQADVHTLSRVELITSSTCHGAGKEVSLSPLMADGLVKEELDHAAFGHRVPGLEDEVSH